MFFADDKDFYLVFDPGNPQYAVTYMEPLLADIRAWLIRNFLMVNDSKTDALVISSRHRPPVLLPPVRVGDDLIHPSATVRNLGVIFDTNMTMVSQISAVVRNSFLSLRDMYKVRQSLPRDATESIVHSFVTTRLDYCNSLYYGLPKKQIKRLQGIQNTAARLVTDTRKYEHITPILRELHWLKVDSRIVFKYLLITYKCLHGLAPKYLSDLLTVKENRGLRSDNKLLLVVPKSRLVTYGDRAFSHAAPKLWNALPDSVRLSNTLGKFKSRLKTYLFKSSYNC